MSQDSSIRDLDYFKNLKNETAGMLSANIYQKYYEISKRSVGGIIDIGVGRGGSSISFALGIRDAGRVGIVHAIDQFSQDKQGGPHLYSRETNPDDNSVLNLAEFNRNVERYGVSDLISAWPHRTIDVTGFPETEAGILVIDVDGHIDRDMALFFDRLSMGGWLILDDCANTIDKRGRARLARVAGKDETAIRVWIARQSDHMRPLILGKHLLTFKLAEFFEDAGIIEKHEIIGSTAFYRKRGDLSAADPEGIARIRRAIEERFVIKALFAETG